jgi:hypothetical protein
MKIMYSSGRLRKKPSLLKASSTCSGSFGLQTAKSDEILELAVVNTPGVSRL